MKIQTARQNARYVLSIYDNRLYRGRGNEYLKQNLYKNCIKILSTWN